MAAAGAVQSPFETHRLRDAPQGEGGASRANIQQKQKDPARTGKPGEAFIVRAPLQHSGCDAGEPISARLLKHLA